MKQYSHVIKHGTSLLTWNPSQVATLHPLEHFSKLRAECGLVSQSIIKTDAIFNNTIILP